MLNLFICSSTATVNPPYPVEHKIEDIHFTLLQDQIEQKKYTPAQKTILESVARNFVKSSKQRLCIFLPTIMIGPVLMPQHLENEFMKLLNNYVKGEDHGWHKEIPSGSMSIAHISDVAKLFVNAYEDESASGRYVAVKESWTWKKIYNELAKYVDKDLLPKDNGVVPDEVTKFDTSKQDKLDVEMTSVAETIEETVKFLKERS